MDWNAAIGKNREALKRVLAGLLAMAGFAAGVASSMGPDRPTTLPRHLHRAVLRLLRPAEAAARRLVIVAARGIVVTLPPRDATAIPAPPVAPGPPPLAPPHKGEGYSVATAPGGNVDDEGATPTSPSPLWGGVRGGGMQRATEPARVDSALSVGGMQRTSRKAGRDGTATARGFPLFDPPSRWGRRRRPSSVSVPRISVPGYGAPFPLRLPPTPFDPIDATPLARRFAALAAALDDLPRQARRFARWQAMLRCAPVPRGPSPQGVAPASRRFRRV